MLSFLFLILLNTPYPCIASSNTPLIITKSLDYISIGDSIYNTVFKDNVSYLKKDREEQVFKSCNDILVYDYKDIVTFEQFHFKLITASCTAIYKYLQSNGFSNSFFPDHINHGFITSLPANSAPIINDYIFNKQKNKSLNQAYKFNTIQDKNNKINLITETEEFYIDIIARGDFDNDDIEDLLVSSQWYARNARGKYNDLVILSKTGKDKPIEITWRMYGPNW